MDFVEEQIKRVPKNHPKDTEIWVLVHRAKLSDVEIPGSSDRLFADVASVLAGDGLLSDRMQAESGQSSVIPDWFTKAVKSLRDKGYNEVTVIPYLRKLRKKAPPYLLP